MRKMIWCAAAFSVASALGVYCASDFAARHPNSTFGQTFVKVVRSSPVGLIGPWPAAVTTEIATQPIGPITPGLGVEDPTEESEPLESIRVELMPICPATTETGPQSPQTAEPQVGPQELQIHIPSELIPASLIRMPTELPPATMPYAPEDMKFDNRFPMETEVEPIQGPGEVSNREPRYIELPEAIANALEIGTIGVGSSELPIGQGKETIPDCKEDPAYHHHYDGCPYLGNARPWHFPVPVPMPIPEEVPAAKPLKSKPLNNATGEHRSLRIDMDDERWHPSQVDTMDYRPREDGPALPSGATPF